MLTFGGGIVEKEFNDEDLLNSKWPDYFMPESFRPSLNGNFAENKMAKSYSPSVSPSNNPSASPTQDPNAYYRYNGLEFRGNYTGVIYSSSTGPSQPNYSFNEFSDDTITTAKPEKMTLPKVKNKVLVIAKRALTF